MPDGGTMTVETAPCHITEDHPESTDKEPDLYATIRVSDTGVGIEEAETGKLFEPLFTTKTRGSGMGLSIVHGMVRDDNGYIDVTSEPGEGTTFTVYIPAATPDETTVTT
jgi:signal transduction histidine kinase